MDHFALRQVGNTVLVDDPFCMFLKMKCKLDSYVDVVFSRANMGKTGCMWVFLYFRNELLCGLPGEDHVCHGIFVTLKGWMGHVSAVNLSFICRRLIGGAL